MFFGHIEFLDRLTAFFRHLHKKKKRGWHRNYFGENLGFTVFHKTETFVWEKIRTLVDWCGLILWLSIVLFLMAYKLRGVTISCCAVCVCLVAQSCVTLCDPMACSPPGSSIHRIFQARMLECVAIFLLQGIFLTQWSNLFPCLLHCKWNVMALPTEPSRKPSSVLRTKLFEET